MEKTLSAKCFSEYVAYIHDLTGITIGKGRTSLIEGRLRKRIKELNVPSFETYLEILKKDHYEQVLFIDLITTNETSFFRTPRIWDYIEKNYLPDWFAKNPSKPFLVWSAASSTGEEASTMGIVCELFKEKNPSFNYSILGTDISKDVVKQCQEGLYGSKSIKNFASRRPFLFKKYLKKTSDNNYQVEAIIRSKLKFEVHNLFRPYFTDKRFDIILIRNVLIYFKPEDQEKVISLLAPRLADEGIMIIGESESLSLIKTELSSVAPLVYKKAS